MSGEANCRTCGRDLALMCRICDADSEHVDTVVALDKAEADVARLRAAIDEAVSSLTPTDVSRIKWPGFHALLKLSAELRSTDARPEKT